MSTLDQKINQYFAGLVVRKDLVKTVKGNAIVPSYVLEYLLGQYCATNDEPTIQAGIATVKEILAKHYVHRNESGLIRSIIKEKGRHKVIDRISVSLNESTDAYEAEFANLGIKNVLVDSATVKKHPKLLVSGVWCLADVEYFYSEDKNASPWIMGTIKPIQLSSFDMESFLAARKQFSTDEWIDLLIQSMGFNPDMFGKRSKLIHLVRLIPFCERNYNLVELGPKGTGKSHIYSEFSPHCILNSEITVAKLFVHNGTGKLGLVGYWDVVGLDEFAGKQKRFDKVLVDTMKTYMANKSFSRGVEPLGAEASMVFIGNTQHTVPHMLKHADLFDPLPTVFHDSAFLDRIHSYVPGWEVDIIRGEMFSDGYGFVVDYIAEILRSLRSQDFSDRYKQHFTLSPDISTRDLDGINKTFSGLMKIVYPEGAASKEEIEVLLRYAMEGRKRVKDQLMRIDTTYDAVNFTYKDNAGKKFSVKTLEEIEYPDNYYRYIANPADEAGHNENASTDINFTPMKVGKVYVEELTEQHLSFQENQRDVSFDALFGKYFKGAKEITLTDAYIRLFYQVRNLMELLETVAKFKGKEDEVKFHLITKEDEFKGLQQRENLEKIKETAASVGIQFSWEYDATGTIHARHIMTDHGWKILLDRGIDIFQQYDMNDAFAFVNRLQQYRQCKAFEVTYIKNQ